jgi:hypothetical protein
MKTLYYKLIRLFLSKIKDTESTLKWELWFGLINNDLSPKKCRYCRNKEFNEIIIDKINSEICEKMVICTKCNNFVGYWSYGHWMP